MKDNKSIKALKKQMAAAVAMVCVAAVALGSSTYAWFVSNNTVKATTASISAQSNAPFLKIAKKGETLATTSATQVAGEGDKTILYPSQWNHVIDSDTYQFESAYAAAADAPDMLKGSRFAVGGVDATYRPDYALKQSFDIGTTDAKAGSFKDLKVSKVELTSTGANGLEAAMSVLVVCGNNWAVYKASNDGAVLTKYTDNVDATGNNTGGVLAATIGAASSVDVDVYVFYDGSETNVYTDNLSNLTAIGATITFTATPVNTQGAEVNAPNGV